MPSPLENCKITGEMPNEQGEMLKEQHRWNITKKTLRSYKMI